ncbi:helix-turn-helix domain-containing protein [Terriglobus albidus]|uniref:helix-turn-helix domain-containing protein n=1 Tax=Terriglobus albidus TaxID=1592106 RepID=UPI0037D9BFA0
MKSSEHSTQSLASAFGAILAARRKKRGFSQMDLAVTSGYSLRYIGDIERGTKSPTLRTMQDLATLLGVRLSQIVLEAERMSEDNSRPNRR